MNVYLCFHSGIHPWKMLILQGPILRNLQCCAERQEAEWLPRSQYVNYRSDWTIMPVWIFVILVIKEDQRFNIKTFRNGDPLSSVIVWCLVYAEMIHFDDTLTGYSHTQYPTRIALHKNVTWLVSLSSLHTHYCIKSLRKAESKH